MSMTEDGRKAEHMTKGELVREFRKLQRWYNEIKLAVDKLEKKYTKLQTTYDEAVNLNLTIQTRVKNQEKLLLNEVTTNNTNKQILFKRIESLQNALYEMQETNKK